MFRLNSNSAIGFYEAMEGVRHGGFVDGYADLRGRVLCSVGRRACVGDCDVGKSHAGPGWGGSPVDGDVYAGVAGVC